MNGWPLDADISFRFNDLLSYKKLSGELNPLLTRIFPLFFSLIFCVWQFYCFAQFEVFPFCFTDFVALIKKFSEQLTRRASWCTFPWKLASPPPPPPALKYFGKRSYKPTDLSVGLVADLVTANRSSSGSSAKRLLADGAGLGDFRPPEGAVRLDLLAPLVCDCLSSSDQSSSS